MSVKKEQVYTECLQCESAAEDVEKTKEERKRRREGGRKERKMNKSVWPS